MCMSKRGRKRTTKQKPAEEAFGRYSRTPGGTFSVFSFYTGQVSLCIGVRAVLVCRCRGKGATRPWGLRQGLREVGRLP